MILPRMWLSQVSENIEKSNFCYCLRDCSSLEHQLPNWVSSESAVILLSCLLESSQSGYAI